MPDTVFAGTMVCFELGSTNPSANLKFSGLVFDFFLKMDMVFILSSLSSFSHSLGVVFQLDHARS
jgi:hypothetical protein